MAEHTLRLLKTPVSIDETARFSDNDDPASAVLAQDACYGAESIDYDRWEQTVFFPLTLLYEGRQTIIEDPAAFRSHLEELEGLGRARGIAGLRTRILSHIQPGDEIAVLSSVRDHLSAEGETVSSTSMTWTVIRTGEGWKINQIHFNDMRYDPSVTTEHLKSKGDI